MMHILEVRAQAPETVNSQNVLLNKSDTAWDSAQMNLSWFYACLEAGSKWNMWATLILVQEMQYLLRCIKKALT